MMSALCLLDRSLGSIGYDDDNTFGFDVTLDGTQISGYETGIIKTGGGRLTLTGDAVITAGMWSRCCL